MQTPVDEDRVLPYNSLREASQQAGRYMQAGTLAILRLLATEAVPRPVIAVSALVSVGLLVSGAFYFRRMEKTFADVV